VEWATKSMNNQYQKERLKLTALYFTIILFIVAIFSVLIIQVQNQQFQRFNRTAKEIANEQTDPRIKIFEPSEDEKARVEEIVVQIKKDYLRIILTLDFAILVLASIISYYLAGKTMEPILKALDGQKRFVSDASHELKTPLTTIMTEAEVLYRDKNTKKEEYREFAKNVMDDVKHLNNLVISLLDTAKLDHNALKINKTEVNIVEIVRSTAAKFEKIAKKKKVEINISAESESCVKTTDKELLHRTLSILIDNAIKYNKENGKVGIKICLDKIEIADTGVGINPESLVKIFDRFYRESEDRNEKGFGLGLSIAKQLSELLNIKLTAESEKDKGSIFTLTFE
jgi:two-component system sensor histidine kinase CiaH